MKVKTLILGDLQTNCYIVSKGNHCLIIDPGANGKKINKYVVDNELVVDAILLTHGHFDHIGAVDYLYDRYGCNIYIHLEDIEMLTNPQLNLSIWQEPFVIKAPVVACNSEMRIGDFEFCWLHLPGHCPGASMIYFKRENIIFSGDVLFKGSIGRDDFANSSRYDTMQSLKIIKEYDFDAIVYPGHGSSTTLKEEQMNNPCLIKS